MSRIVNGHRASHAAGRDRTWGNLGLAVVALIVAGLVLMTLVAACGSSPSEPTQAPAIDGKTLLDTRCSVCHGVDRVTQATKTADQWEQTVTRMIGHGAQLTDAEKAVLVDYLTKNYGQ